jgi:hypothetical protein
MSRAMDYWLETQAHVQTTTGSLEFYYDKSPGDSFVGYVGIVM